MENLKVSVLVTYHQANAPFISSTISSLSNQEFKDFEVIIIAQDTLPADIHFNENIPYRIHHWKPQKDDIGLVAKARNLGLDMIKGKYIKILDSDDILYPDYLKTCVNLLDQLPEVGLVYTDYLINKSGNKILMEASEFDLNLLLNWNFIGCSTVMYRKNNLRFNEQINHWEDYEFWLRLLLDHNYKFKRIPKALVEWRDHPAQKSKNIISVEKEITIIENIKKQLRERHQ